MKVECVYDDKQGDMIDTLGNVISKGDRVRFGEIYVVVGTYQHTGEPMYVLAGMDRNCQMYGKGWGTHRFKPLKRSETKTIAKSKEVELV